MSRKAEVDKVIFRKTHEHVGRRLSVTPRNSSMRHLAYGRTILNSSQPKESFATGDRETGLVCLSGTATVKADEAVFRLEPYDSLYVPRDSSVQVTTDSTVDLAEFSAEVAKKYPRRHVRFREIMSDPGLRFSTGGPGSTRQVNLLIAKNVEAGRLLMGFTTSEPGNWTSWPPHEHSAMLEEMYVYFKMPPPAYAIQLVYKDTDNPELVTVVRDGDAVLIPAGFHPNVAVPGYRICFLWAMAAHREVEDRQFGVVNVQREFHQGPSGLEAGQKK